MLDGAEQVVVPADLEERARPAITPKAVRVQKVRTSHEARATREDREEWSVPDNVIENDPREIRIVVDLLCFTRKLRRIEEIGRHMTFFAIAQDCFDRAVDEEMARLMIDAWIFHDNETENEFVEALRQAGCDDAADLAGRVCVAGAKLADLWSKDSLDVDDVEKMVNDAEFSRTAAIGCLYGTPSPLVNDGATLTPIFDGRVSADLSDAIAVMECDAQIGVPLDVSGKELEAVMTREGIGEAICASAQAVVRAGPEAIADGQLRGLFGLSPIGEPHAVEEDGSDELPPEQVVIKEAKQRAKNIRFEDAWSLVGEPDEAPDFLIDDMLEAGALFVLHGKPGAGKSALVLDMLLRLSFGMPWAGRETKRCGVLYVSAEGPAGTKRRLRAWARRNAPQDAQRPAFEVVRAPVDLFGSDTGLGVITKHLQDFEASHGIPCGIVVFDTLRAMMTGGDENSATDIGQITARMIRLRDATGAAVGLVHHTGKDKTRGASGSTAIVGNFDVELIVEKAGEGRGKLTAGKLRDGFLAGVLPFALLREQVGVKANGAPVIAVVAQLDADRPAGAAMGAVDDTADDEAVLKNAPIAVVIPVREPDDFEARKEQVLDAAKLLQARGPTFKFSELLEQVNLARAKAKPRLKPLSRTTLRPPITELIEAGTVLLEGAARDAGYRLQEG